MSEFSLPLDTTSSVINSEETVVSINKATSSGDGTIGQCHTCGCIGPNPGYIAMTLDEIQSEMKNKLKPYHWIIGEDLKSIRRSITCRNFKAAISYIDKVAEAAERSDIQHHPDIHLTKYRNIDIILSTHAVDGLTAYDFKLAAAIDEITVDYSPKWLKEHPELIL